MYFHLNFANQQRVNFAQNVSWKDLLALTWRDIICECWQGSVLYPSSKFYTMKFKKNHCFFTSKISLLPFLFFFHTQRRFCGWFVNSITSHHCRLSLISKSSVGFWLIPNLAGFPWYWVLSFLWPKIGTPSNYPFLILKITAS